MRGKVLRFGLLVFLAGLIAFLLKFREGYDYFDQTWWASVLAMVVGGMAIVGAQVLTKK